MEFVLIISFQEKFLQPIESFSKQTNPNKQENEDGSNNQAYWRGGPAKLWYDMLGVPENGEEFDYGFKLKDSKVRTHYINCSVFKLKIISILCSKREYTSLANFFLCHYYLFGRCMPTDENQSRFIYSILEQSIGSIFKAC